MNIYMEGLQNYSVVYNVECGSEKWKRWAHSFLRISFQVQTPLYSNLQTDQVKWVSYWLILYMYYLEMINSFRWHHCIFACTNINHARLAHIFRLSKVQYLDLSMAVVETKGLEQLLSTSHLLRKLSLEHVEVNDTICK